MKIAYIVPGTGGQFYCENCIRDVDLIGALRKLGHEVSLIPMYLPIKIGSAEIESDTPIFYGAVNIYLKQTIPLFRRCPGWLSRLFDSPSLLRWVSNLSGSTRASGLGEMTLSMLKGEDGNQAAELDRLIHYLKHDMRPDVVHLSNALLLGPAHRIREELNIPIVCSLQDEDTWVLGLEPEYAEATWRLLADKATYVDLFTPVSQYYSELMQNHMHVDKNKMKVVPLGIPLKGYKTSSLSLDAPVIGFLSRFSKSQGLTILVDAFIRLKSESHHQNLRLSALGGMTGDDEGRLVRLKQRLAKSGFIDDVEFIQEYDLSRRIEFLSSLTLLTVPVLRGGAFGMFLLEAMASGVPVVQPRLSAFPEIIENSQSGVLYDPNTPESLAQCLSYLLQEPDKMRQMGRNGLDAVQRDYGIDAIAPRMAKIYAECVSSAIG